MWHRFDRIAAIGVIALTLLIQGGCSVIGYGIGSAIDSRKGSKGEVPESKWTTLSTDQPVRVIRDSGSFITGWYVGATTASSIEYRNRYETWRKIDSTRDHIPAPGDSISLALATGEIVSGRLIGYERRFPEKAQVRSGSPAARRRAFILSEEPEGVLVVSHADSAGFARVPARSVTQVSGTTGRELSSTELSDRIASRNLPTMSMLTVVSESRIWNLPVDGIRRLETTSERGSARWIGLGLGAACDIVLIAAMIAFGDGIDFGSGGMHGI